MTLADLHEGDSAIITKVSGRGAFRRRIMEMGFIKGTEVTVIKKAPLRDQVEYELKGYKISLRNHEASMIGVVSIEEASAMARSSFPGTITFEQIHKTARIRSRTIHLALVGNPNAGKTTLFNFITGSNEHTANYSGVTVEARLAELDFQGYHFIIADLRAPIR
jgi:ferrous iron transport protein B